MTPNQPTYSNGNPEYSNNNIIDTATDNISKVSGQHSLKAESMLSSTGKSSRAARRCNGYTGAYNFTTDANNPLNTNDGFANALLAGYYDTYNEWTAKIVVNDTFWNVEFYAQDNWRFTKRLTLDLGLPFYHQTPEVDKQAGNLFAYFDPSTYNKATAPRFYVPAIVGGKRAAQDPATGATAGVGAIGLFIPNSGNPADGFVTAGVNGVPYNDRLCRVLCGRLRGGAGRLTKRATERSVYSMPDGPML